MPNPYRQAKMGEQIAQEVSDLLRTRIKDPRVGFASITRVEMSGDLRHAKIFVSVMGENKDQKGTIEALHHATGFIRHELAERLTIRFMPEIAFKLDTSIEQGSRILGLIREMQDQEKQKSALAEESHESTHSEDKRMMYEPE
ncbi:MAG: 30S ribosome-binding factor RbfA [Ktedonobacteraceae bacterium]